LTYDKTEGSSKADKRLSLRGGMTFLCILLHWCMTEQAEVVYHNCQ